MSGGDATHVAETLPQCRLARPTRASALLPPQLTSHTTPLLLQVTLTTEPAAGFVYLAASRCRCRYALTTDLPSHSISRTNPLVPSLTAFSRLSAFCASAKHLKELRLPFAGQPIAGTVTAQIPYRLHYGTAPAPSTLETAVSLIC